MRMSMRTTDRTDALASLHGKYLSLTTFKRDGTGVATPVWFVPDGDRLLVETDQDSFKVKRIRHDPSATIALCSATGRLQTAPQPARAEILPVDDVARTERLMRKKYRVDAAIFRPIRALQCALHIGPRRGGPVVLAITPR